jgi:molecular chaperone GrpE (heat shock protein)
MKSKLLCVRLLMFLATIGTFGSAVAQDSITDLENEKKKLEIESSIEKLKAEIAESKKKQREAEALQELWVRKQEAEARKAEAEAERGELLAKIPPSKIEALKGTIDAKDFGSAGLVIAVDTAREMAVTVCDDLASDKKTVIYDETMASGVISSNLLQTQLGLFQSILDSALQKNEERDFKTTSLGPGFDAAIATGTIKAFADLASLFKTNVTITKTDFSDAKSVFVTSMARSCPEKLSSIGEGYIGELDMKPLETLRRKALKILGDRAKLQERINNLKASAEGENNNLKKKELQTTLEELVSVATQVDGFLNVLKPNDVNDKSPLPTAARYLAFSKRIGDSNIMNLGLSLEGLSIVKEGLFTGQKLRLSASAIVWYRIYENNGSLIKANVLRHMAKPVQVDLRGSEPNDQFWNGNY